MHVNISFSMGEKYSRELMILSDLVEKKEIAVTVSLSEEYIVFSFDEEYLHGYGIDERERRKDVKDIKEKALPKEEEKELIKVCYRGYYDGQRERKLAGKNENRCIAVDLNPEFIGCCIVEKQPDGTMKELKVWHYDFTYYFQKHGWNSSDKRQKRLNDKRRYELTIVLKQIFMIAMHYQCAYFSMEDLDFKGDIHDEMTREVHRKTKNLWCRMLTTQIIQRRCAETGIQIIRVLPHYSSIIGNIQHPYSDPCSASLEIARRGMLKYINGSFYPYVRTEGIDTLKRLFSWDVQCSTNLTDLSWIGIYKSLCKDLGSKEVQHRLRTLNVTAESRSVSVVSRKSRVLSVEFSLCGK